MVVGSRQRCERARRIDGDDADPRLAFGHGRAVAEHRSVLARVAHALLPYLVRLVEAGKKHIERKLTHWLGHQRFDLHVGELAGESDQAAQNERFARDIHPGKIVARVGLGVAVVHRRAESA